jgi:hypothetical protein
VKKELDDRLGIADREQVARLALLTAVSDGHFVPAETKILKKIYSLLGLDPGKLFSDLHALGADTELATVQPANPGRQQFAIPRPPDEAPSHEMPALPIIQLDLGLIERKLADTQRAAALLLQVFQDEHEPPMAQEADGTNTNEGGATFEGLSHAQALLLRRLLEKRFWTHDAYRSLAAEFDVMPEGTLESLNEWAIKRIGDILIEAGEPIEIYHDVWQEYLDEQQTHQT